MTFSKDDYGEVDETGWEGDTKQCWLEMMYDQR